MLLNFNFYLTHTKLWAVPMILYKSGDKIMVLKPFLGQSNPKFFVPTKQTMISCGE